MSGQWDELRDRMLDRKKRSLFRVTIVASLIASGITLGLILATIPLWP